ncbi:unnamed protein product [Toxocara canis]|uniref:WWE domain-containing protein n=1 Tax=Toxocara canis TaxID=6265 RepID=A0A183VHI6_TOXCA|nr:unnamed protein product [Toxocara canis]
MSSFDFYKKQERDEWEYSWEWAQLSTGWDGQWTNVIGMQQSLSVVDKTIEVLKRFKCLVNFFDYHFRRTN